MQDLLLEQLQARKNRKNYALVTIVDSFGSTPRTSGKMLVYEGGLSKGTVGGGPHEQMAKQDAVQCIRSGCNALKRYEIKSDGEVCTGGISVFIEVFRVAPLLVVCGGGHVGRNLIPMAKMVGFDVLLVDTRAPEIISEAVSLADRFERVSDFRSGLCALAIEPEAYYVLCAYSHAADCAALQAVLDKSWAYAGMVGSRTKIDSIFSQLRQKGYTNAQLLGSIPPSAWTWAARPRRRSPWPLWRRSLPYSMESKNNFKAYFFRRASCFLRGFALYYWLFLKKMNGWDRIPSVPPIEKRRIE